MAAQYHSKICAHAHNAMEELFGSGLPIRRACIISTSFAERTQNRTRRRHRRPPLAPWLAEIREQVVPEITYAPAPTAKAKPAPQPGRTTRVKAPTASASYAAAAIASATARKEIHAQAARPAAEPRAARPKAPAPSAQPAKPRAAMPKAEDWQFPQGAQSFQSAALAARPAPAGAFKQSPPRQRSAAELRQLREREGVSEAVFARCLGVPPQTVIAWEGGVVLPSPRFPHARCDRRKGPERRRLRRCAVRTAFHSISARPERVEKSAFPSTFSGRKCR